MSYDQKVLPLPPNDDQKSAPDDAALDLIRSKVSALYGNEPSAAEEAAEVKNTGVHSPHQQYMQSLMASGDDMATVQTKWHEYYQGLSDQEKRDVWREFYANHEATEHANKTAAPAQAAYGARKIPRSTSSKPTEPVVGHIEDQDTALAKTSKKASKRNPKPKKSVAELKEQVRSNVSAQGRLQRKHHIQSLLFGLGVGAVVMFVFMFGFFNERLITPFITPSRTVSNTPIIVDPSQSSSVGADPKVLIPKINVEVAVVYDVGTIDENAIQNALERGVVHYPTTPVPGQNGNVVVVGHSSNNIFNRGKYKFAFVALSRLEIGDTFMLHYNGTRYVYKIYEKRIVKPTDVSVLGTRDRAATATLITCDPPGTALNRLIVVGEQISPASGNNVAAAPTNLAAQPAIVPGNPESLFQRLFGWL